MMSSPERSRAIDPQALDEAAEWLMRLGEGRQQPGEQAEWARWYASSPERARAWSRAELLLGKLGSVPPSLAMSALDRPASPDRRAALGKLSALLALAPLAWGSWKLNDWQQWTADYRTRVGERRELVLADGSQLTLNTDSAVDIRFDSQMRLLLLRRGEILVQTAADRSSAARPFFVDTAQGRLQALDSRFSVRERSGQTLLTVLEGSVDIQLRGVHANQSQRVGAGQKTHFASDTIAPVEHAEKSALAWTRGMLMADNLPLSDFIGELARYRRGFIRCDPAIANLRISGAYPLNDSSRSLNMLASTYPVSINAAVGSYWIMLSPA